MSSIGPIVVTARNMSGMTAGSVTASTAASGMPGSNVINPARTRVWRSTSDTMQYVDFDFGSAVYLDTLAVVSHNLTTAGTVYLAVGSTAGASDLLSLSWDVEDGYYGFGEGGFGDNGYGGTETASDIALTFPAGPIFFMQYAGVVGRYVRVTFDDPTNPDGYIQIGRIILDEGRQAEYPPGSYANRPHDPSVISYSLGGQKFVDRRAKYRMVSAEMPLTPSTETYGFWDALFAEVGSGTDFVIDLIPDAATALQRAVNRLYCHIPQESVPDISVEILARGAFTLTLRESL